MHVEWKCCGVLWGAGGVHICVQGVVASILVKHLCRCVLIHLAPSWPFFECCAVCLPCGFETRPHKLEVKGMASMFFGDVFEADGPHSCCFKKKGIATGGLPGGLWAIWMAPRVLLPPSRLNHTNMSHHGCPPCAAFGQNGDFNFEVGPSLNKE